MKNILLLTCLCAIIVSCRDADNNPEMPQAASHLVISRSDVTQDFQYSASIRGKQDIDVRPQISGLIDKVCVSEGERVQKGQTLFIIDQVSYLSELEICRSNEKMATAEVATARLEAESKRVLAGQNVVSEHDLQVAENMLANKEAQLSQARAQVRNAENNLSFTVIKSPSDGVVGTLPYKVGALVSPDIQTPLTTVSDNSEMFVYFSLTENRALELLEQFGSVRNVIDNMPEVRLLLNTGNTYTQTGHISSISGVIDPSTGSVSVKAVFPNPNGLLLSGASGKVLIPQKRDGAILIPQTATFEIQDKRFVYKVENDKAVSKEIAVSFAGDGNNFIVEKGLEPGDIIVAEGVTTLRDGASIESTHKGEKP